MRVACQRLAAREEILDSPSSQAINRYTPCVFYSSIYTRKYYVPSFIVVLSKLNVLSVSYLRTSGMKYSGTRL